eukprot:6211990-Pleurochrysis_carterae.AAC.7
MEGTGSPDSSVRRFWGAPASVVDLQRPGSNLRGVAPSFGWADTVGGRRCQTSRVTASSVPPCGGRQSHRGRRLSGGTTQSSVASQLQNELHA